MKLRIPPLHISHWEEIKIFNDFMKENNTLSNSKCIELAELYKEKFNGIQIFPKLPSIIKQYYKQWKANSLIKLAQNAMKENYDRLLGLYSLQKITLKKEYDNQCKENQKIVKLPIAANTMRVSSAVNSSQYLCVPIKESKDKIKHCSNYPICADTTNICNGFRPLLCKNNISTNITLPSKK